MTTPLFLSTLSIPISEPVLTPSPNGIIPENVASRFMKEVEVLETRALYSFQMENFHFEMFNLLLDRYVKDSAQKVHHFRTID
ncbi:Ribonucleoside-diphosphate reductase small chain C, partial [Mucuna pruriens]